VAKLVRNNFPFSSDASSKVYVTGQNPRKSKTGWSLAVHIFPLLVDRATGG